MRIEQNNSVCAWILDEQSFAVAKILKVYTEFLLFSLACTNALQITYAFVVAAFMNTIKNTWLCNQLKIFEMDDISA